MSIDKKEPTKDGSEESVPSSPENEHNEPDRSSVPQESQPAKRKGGRKPIYATSEERKQRNRQAQAAFRERRTEYIKQLEETIRVHESNLSNLQAAHRSAADECLMLRYKNSLLERILLEKGIDVQAELRAKTGSPNLGPSHMAPSMVQPPPIQRAILSRHHSRRSTSSIAPKPEPGIPSLPPPIHGFQPSTASPKARPTPPSHGASPTTATPNFSSGQSLASPTTTSHPGMPGPIPPHLKPQMPPMPEQEYDAPNEMIEEVESDTPGPNPYSSGYPGVQQQQHRAMHLPPPTTGSAGQPTSAASEQGAQTQGQGYPSMSQLLDPALDWDPFGLSASMAFPTQFSFDTSNMR
ncbi:hypothetical protein DL764_007741 [Monosporascus ibericus]|uniref:BZIP domain-containing protein n=1 Tax=Monosporascus ibericus TaxID=155417 RepID=A0A4Q4T1D5_9PEZI|nr:hypothetical protein DL764_007741 [Monosporascus ibericus]